MQVSSGSGMGVVTVSSSAARASLGLSRRLSTHQTTAKRSVIVGFKADKSKANAFVAPCEPIRIETRNKENEKRTSRRSKKVRVAITAEAPPSAPEVDFSEAAAKLETMYKLSPAIDASDLENLDHPEKESRKGRRKKIGDKSKMQKGVIVVRNRMRSVRLSLDKRIEMKKNKEETKVHLAKQKKAVKTDDEKIEELLRGPSVTSVGDDWKTMKIPPVLSSSEQRWLFKLMEPMKAILQEKKKLQRDLGDYPTDRQLGEAMKMPAVQIRRHFEVGRAAKSKLIQHNLRLVSFAMNKYFPTYINGPNYQALCQAGVKGLITAIDRFDPRKSQLSTYALFWIRSAIFRSMPFSGFAQVPASLEAVRIKIQKAKSSLTIELNRAPTEEEIIKKVGISPKKYRDVKLAARPVYSLNARHPVTQEELTNVYAETDSIWVDERRQPARLRLALDDVLDSLKPKESIVIRQRYGLDGRGDRTLGEIAGNLNISREMVRKHEMKALMKLKHPTRVEYLREYIC